MELNRETAMRLWCKAYGSMTKVKDFSGREIAKGAYNDRNSDFGWNVDHILPQSRGGKTTDHNLVCCHILTNDEKADSFPCFSANGSHFQIVKVENHYEIQPVTKAKQTAEDADTDEVNFYDSAAGIRFFKHLKGIQNKPRFVGTVFVLLENVNNMAVIDFIERIFDEESISYAVKPGYFSFSNGTSLTVTAKNNNLPTTDDTSKLLDKCVLLNTYLGHYFVRSDYLHSYDIYFRLDSYQEKKEMYNESPKTDIFSVQNSFYPQVTTSVPYSIRSGTNYSNSLFINELVYINTEAKEKVEKSSGQYTEYDFVYTKLSENLDKEVFKE